MSGLRHPGNRINVFRSVICLERFVDVFVSNASHHSGMMYKVRYERVFSLSISTTTCIREMVSGMEMLYFY
jgi:hypothetical protein